MYGITAEVAIFILVMITILHQLVYIYITSTLGADCRKNEEISFYKIYFLIGLLGIAHGAYVEAVGLKLSYIQLDMTYFLCTALLFPALNESFRKKSYFLLSGFVIGFLGFLNWYYPNWFVHIHALVALIGYGLLGFYAYQRGMKEDNTGYFVMIIAFSIKVLSGLYLLQVPPSDIEVIHFNLIAISSLIGFLVVGLGFMTVILRSEYKRMQTLAMHDALTGVNNRNGFEHSLAALLPYMARSQKAVSLMVLDIDFFKKINDTYGHDGGDAVLIDFAKNLNDVKRQSDIVCRFGGEEFVVLLPDTDEKDAKVFAEKVRKSVEGLTILFNKIPIKITVSCGMTTWRENINIDTMISEADKALYYSKENGRNCCTHVHQLNE